MLLRMGGVEAVQVGSQSRAKDKVILRRRSWLAVTWGGIALVSLLGVAAWQSVMAKGNVQDAWIVLTVGLGSSAVMRRIGSCRLVLLPDHIRVENLIGAHDVPYSHIAYIDQEGSGGLRIETSEGSEINCFAFSRSMVDVLFKTSSKAERMIKERMPQGGESGAGGGRSGGITRFRICWTSETLFAAACVTAVVAALQ